MDLILAIVLGGALGGRGAQANRKNLLITHVWMQKRSSYSLECKWSKAKLSLEFTLSLPPNHYGKQYA